MIDGEKEFKFADIARPPLSIDKYNLLNEDPNDQDEEGYALLHKYATLDNFEARIMEGLLANGADLEMRNHSGKTAFLVAVVWRNREMIESLIEHDADVHVKDRRGNNALHYMALPELNHYLETIDDDPRFEVPEEEKFNFDDTYSILHILLNKGIDVNSKNNRGDTPLMWAARGNYLVIVEMLLAYGANVHARNKKMETCLHFASTYNKENAQCVKRWTDKLEDIVLELARNKACVNCFDRDGRTAVGKILSSGHEQTKLTVAWELIRGAALVNWRKRIDVHLNQQKVLGEKRKVTVAHLNRCYNEIDQMKVYQLTDGLNLCQFARRGVSEAEKGNASKIYDDVLDILLKKVGNFRFYYRFILSSFERSYLRQKASESDIYFQHERQELRFNGDVIFKLSSFLDNIDIFKLLSVSKRPRSVETSMSEEQTE